MSLLVNTVASPSFRGPAPALSRSDADTLVAHLRRELCSFGFDVVEPLCLGWYNDALTTCHGSRIPPRGGQGQSALTLLVGNTRKIWDLFLEACSCDLGLINSDNPFDTYVERAVSAAVGSPSPRSQPRCFWAHKQSDELEGGPGYVAIQQMASAVGLAYLDPNSHLCLHPKYGPWFALRCVLVFDEVEYQGRRGPSLPCPLDHTTQEYVRNLMRSAERASSCELAAGKQSNWDAVKCQWHKWVAVREAPCPGHPWRYSPAQLEYHYTRNNTLLASVLRERAKARSSPPGLRLGPRMSDSGIPRSVSRDAVPSPPRAAAGDSAGAQPSRATPLVKSHSLSADGKLHDVAGSNGTHVYVGATGKAQALETGGKTHSFGGEVKSHSSADGKAGLLRSALSRLTGSSHGHRGLSGSGLRASGLQAGGLRT